MLRRRNDDEKKRPTVEERAVAALLQGQLGVTDALRSVAVLPFLQLARRGQRARHQGRVWDESFFLLRGRGPLGLPPETTKRLLGTEISTFTLLATFQGSFTSDK